MTDNLTKLKGKLAELFQLNNPDLDFGMYRILNAKRDDINDFLNKKLIPQVREELEKYKAGGKSEVKDQLDKVLAQCQELGVDPESNPKVISLRKQMKGSVDITAVENEIYSHLYSFFSRYYEDGDFLSRQKISRDAKYAIPYNGEEVKLHWANQDQYYVKSSEYLRDYAFKLPVELGGKVEKKVHFKLVDADTEKDNTKAESGDKRKFVLYDENPYAIDGDELTIFFEYKIDKADQKKLNEDASARIQGEKEIAQKFPMLFKDESIKKVKKETRILLDKHLTDYTARNTYDYFIHKDLGGFLKRELDFYIKNEVMHLDDIEEDSVARVELYLDQIRVIRKVAHKVIEFLAQLENFQKKLWLKKKFVVETNYCITLDRIPKELYAEIAANEEQREEWVKLYAIDEIEEKIGATGEKLSVGYTVPLTVEFLEANSHMILDTKWHSEGVKLKITNVIEQKNCNDGELIWSDNFQALSLIKHKYSNSIKSIYIDPPYNTGQDEFLYKDKYQHSAWASMLIDRINIGDSLLTQDGTFSMSIDLNEVGMSLVMLDHIFGKENRSYIATVKRGSVTGHKAINPGVVNVSEYIVSYSAQKSYWNPNRVFKARDRNDRYNNYIVNFEDDCSEWRFCSLLDSFSDHIGIKKTQLRSELGELFEKTIYDYVKDNAQRVIQLAFPDIDKVSKEAQEIIHKSKKDNTKVYHLPRANEPDLFIYKGQRLLFYSDRLKVIDGELETAEPLSDIWDDVLPNDLHNEGQVKLKKGKKPEKLIKRIFDITTTEKDYILDFFAGSGTALATAQKMHLKWIGVEQGPYFETITLKRLMNTLNGDKSGVSKACEYKGGGAFKYLRLESYEDCLNNLRLKSEKSHFLSDPLDEDYKLHYMLDVETKDSLLNIDMFTDPFNYTMNIATGTVGETKPTKVDLVETFNYLLGLKVAHTYESRGFRVVEGTNPEGEKVLVIWRSLNEKSHEDLDDFFEKSDFNTQDMEFSYIYVNGDNCLENKRKPDQTWKVRLIEQEFKRLMFEDTET